MDKIVNPERLVSVPFRRHAVVWTFISTQATVAMYVVS